MPGGVNHEGSTVVACSWNYHVAAPVFQIASRATRMGAQKATHPKTFPPAHPSSAVDVAQDRNTVLVSSQSNSFLIRKW